MIYLDNAATTKVDKEVLKSMLPYFKELYGNASSHHSLGKDSRNAVEGIRKIIADSLNAKSEEIFFTSGGTESNNLALKWIDEGHIITTKIEHESVLEVCKFLEGKGVNVSYLDVDADGLIDLKMLEKSIKKDTKLVSIIHGNNEIGVLQDVEKIGGICRKKEVLLHIDACQSFGKVPLNVKKLHVDLITLNAHKIHGPKGIGALYVRKGVKIKPLFHGGGHEQELRSGTENVPAIVGFGKAIQELNKKDVEKMDLLRDRLISKFLEMDEVKLQGSRDRRLCNNVNIGFLGVDSEILESALDVKGIKVSSGAACSSHRLKKSHVLKALPGNDKYVENCIRFSLSKYNTKREIDQTFRIVRNLVERMRSVNIK